MTEKARKPWLSGLLSLWCPGMGHLYNGKPGLGIGLGVLSCLILALGTNLCMQGMFGVLLYLLLLGAWLLGVAGSATRGAKREPVIRITRWQSFLAYTLFAVGSTLGSYVVKPLYRIEPIFLQAEKQPPGLEQGDVIMVDRYAYRSTAPARGQLVVWNGEARRVVGVAGDPNPSGGLVPEDQLYVQGGPADTLIPVAEVTGKPAFIYVSISLGVPIGIRWERNNQELQ